MNKLKCLKKGDTICLVAPSGPLRNINIEEVKYKLEKIGYNIKLSNTCCKSYKGYLSGTDKERAADLEKAFLDKSVDVVLCLRGGYGSTRILDLIDFDIIKNNPKVFIGFSDITALHIAINQICDMPTIHGIMAASIKKWDYFTYNSLKNAINFDDKLLIKNPFGENLIPLYRGSCRGKIIGGNLSLIISTLGTKYEINTKDKILFIEEIGEYTYKIDKMLNHLEMAGKFEDCKGIIFGEFTDCKPAFEKDQEVINIIQEIAIKNKKPTLCNLKSGHCLPMVSLPLNMNAFLDCDKKQIIIEK